MVDWTKLPEELLRMIAVRSFSAVELKRFCSICKTWRSSVSTTDTPLSTNPLIKLKPLVISVYTNGGLQQINDLNLYAFLSRASFFRVTLSSSSTQGWLIKSDVDINLGTLHLLHPLSRLPLLHWCQSFDLFKFTLTEIRQGFLVHYSRSNEAAFGFKKLVLAGKDRVFGIGFDGKIRYWNGEIWTRIKDQIGEFVDIMVLKGLIYALDSQGIVWWISSYSLSIFRYGTSLTNECGRDLSLVECCGELYIVDRLLEENVLKRKADSLDDDNAYVGVVPRITNVIHDDVGNEKCKVVERECPKTVGFKVYKVDEELGKWVEVKSLGDSAVVVATDTCFSVLAREYYGCVPNSIYFIDEKEVEVKVFKLDDGSIASMFGFERSCFQMFVPSFLCIKSANHLIRKSSLSSPFRVLNRRYN